MLRRSLPLTAPIGSSSSGRDRSGNGSSDLQRSVRGFTRKVLQWYPERGGEFIGNALAGHNVFIQDLPKKFDKQHARHFSLVEAVTITPTFTLSMVHYLSMFSQHPSRSTALLSSIFTELTEKTAAQAAWLAVLQQRSPLDVVAWRAVILLLQLALFPLSVMWSAAAPQLVHATLAHTNHILQTKYACIAEGGPPFVTVRAAQCAQASDFHRSHMRLPTDYGVAVVMVLLVLYITS